MSSAVWLLILRGLYCKYIPPVQWFHLFPHGSLLSMWIGATCNMTTEKALAALINPKCQYLLLLMEAFVSAHQLVKTIFIHVYKYSYRALLITAPEHWLGDSALRWRHNGRDSVSNHQPHDCLLNRLFRRWSKKTSKLRVTGLCAGNSPGTGEFPAQMAIHAENVSIWWRHHGM